MSNATFTRYAAAITYAALHTALDSGQRETFALGYARTAYPTPGSYFRSAQPEVTR
jgi:hypothetical protein